jgi:hypothetical protein
LAISNIASNTEIDSGSIAKCIITEKKRAIITTNATLILTGMLFHPKTGRTKKNAEILVSTITKASSFSNISRLQSVPDILDVPKKLVGKSQYHLEHPATTK